MSRRAAVTQAALERAARVAKRCGVGVEVDLETGKIIILPEPAKTGEGGARNATEVVAERLRMMGGKGG